MGLFTPSSETQRHGFFVRQMNIGLQQKSNRYYRAYSDESILQQLIAKLPWGIIYCC
jgi:hypothetical protein